MGPHTVVKQDTYVCTVFIDLVLRVQSRPAHIQAQIHHAMFELQLEAQPTCQV